MYNPFGRKNLEGIFKSFNKVIDELTALIEQNYAENVKLNTVIDEAASKIARNANESVVAQAARDNLSKLLGK